MYKKMIALCRISHQQRLAATEQFFAQHDRATAIRKVRAAILALPPDRNPEHINTKNTFWFYTRLKIEGKEMLLNASFLPKFFRRYTVFDHHRKRITVTQRIHSMDAQAFHALGIREHTDEGLIYAHVQDPGELIRKIQKAVQDLSPGSEPRNKYNKYTLLRRTSITIDGIQTSLLQMFLIKMCHIFTLYDSRGTKIVPRGISDFTPEIMAILGLSDHPDEKLLAHYLDTPQALLHEVCAQIMALPTGYNPLGPGGKLRFYKYVQLKIDGITTSPMSIFLPKLIARYSVIDSQGSLVAVKSTKDLTAPLFMALGITAEQISRLHRERYRKYKRRKKKSVINDSEI